MRIRIDLNARRNEWHPKLFTTNLGTLHQVHFRKDAVPQSQIFFSLQIPPNSVKLTNFHKKFSEKTACS